MDSTSSRSGNGQNKDNPKKHQLSLFIQHRYHKYVGTLMGRLTLQKVHPLGSQGFIHAVFHRQYQPAHSCKAAACTWNMSYQVRKFNNVLNHRWFIPRKHKWLIILTFHLRECVPTAGATSSYTEFYADKSLSASGGRDRSGALSSMFLPPAHRPPRKSFAYSVFPNWQKHHSTSPPSLLTTEKPLFPQLCFTLSNLSVSHPPPAPLLKHSCLILHPGVFLRGLPHFPWQILSWEALFIQLSLNTPQVLAS